MAIETSSPAHTATRRRSPLLAVVLAVAIAAGFAVGFLLREQGLTDVNAQLAAVKKDSLAAQERMKALDLDIAARDAQIATLQESGAKIADLETKVATLTKQLSAAGQASAGSERLGLLADGLANDRLLLVEMRKNPPKNRTDARRYWQGIKDASLKSSPTLAPMADKVINSVQAYYTWSEREYPSAEERALTYILTGANQYDVASKDFWNAFLKVAIDRMDAVVMSLP